MMSLIEWFNLQNVDRDAARAVLGIATAWAMVGVSLLALRFKTRR